MICGWPTTFTTGGVLSMSTGSLNRSPDSLLSRRIVRRIGGDDLDHVAPVGESRTIDRVKVVAQLVFQQPERLFIQSAIIDRIFQRVGVAILSLPLKRTRATLIKTAWRHLRHWSKQRRVQP